MKYLKKIILISIISAISLYAIFFIFFALGTIDTNRSKSLDSNVVSECIADLKNKNKDLELKDLEIYYQQGKIQTNIYFENSLSLNESKTVIKSLKEFITKDNINKYLAKKHSSQLYINAVIYSKDNSYYYECPYYIKTTDLNVKNNYKTWYLTNSDGETIEEISIE